MKPKLVRWVLAHEPIELFILAAKKFVRLLDERAPGRLNVEILTLSEYSEKYQNNRHIAKNQLIDHLMLGDIELSQLYTYRLSAWNKDLDALDLPFLFDNHDTAARVFEGDIGADLMQGYEKNNPKIKGLAYTYSGGFKNIIFRNEVSSLDDFRGAKIRVSDSPVLEATFSAIGSIPARFEIEALRENLHNGAVDAGEITWSRYYGGKFHEVTKTIYDTEHSLLITNIVANSAFFNDLDLDLQTIVKQAAVEAGRYEREISILDAPVTEKRAIQDGIKVIKLTPGQRQRFKESTQTVYDQFKDVFSPGLVLRLKSA